MNLVIFIWELLVSLLSGVWELISGILEFSLSIAHWLHFESPRLEGLLVGVLLAWLLARRDKHPALRVLSSPLRLVLEVLDLAWDHLVEFMSDTKATVVGLIQQGWGVVLGGIRGVWSSMLGGLASLRDRLRRKS